MDVTADVQAWLNGEPNHGWLLRYMHANGASFFFIAVYLHIARGLYYGSYKAPRELLQAGL